VTRNKCISLFSQHWKRYLHLWAWVGTVHSQSSLCLHYLLACSTFVVGKLGVW